MEYTAARAYDLSLEDRRMVEKAVRSNPMISHPEDCFGRLMVENYWFVVEKL